MRRDDSALYADFFLIFFYFYSVGPDTIRVTKKVKRQETATTSRFHGIIHSEVNARDLIFFNTFKYCQFYRGVH